MKKTLISATIVIFLVSAGYIFSRNFRKTKNNAPAQQTTSPAPKITSINDIKEIPDRTGGTPPQPIESDIKEGEAVNNLQKALPLSIQFFTITKYDYSKAEFVVVGYNGTPDLEGDFDTWLKSSSYSAIPKSMFLLSQ